MTAIILKECKVRVSWKKDSFDQYRDIEVAREGEKDEEIYRDDKLIEIDDLGTYDRVEVRAAEGRRDRLRDVRHRPPAEARQIATRSSTR